MGDALRDIDAKSLIRSDFVLIYGDVVSNIKLQGIMEAHK
jgi:translation initiation factor eIF-2B subunit epsilon